MSNFTANPSESADCWFVWDAEAGWPSAIVFVGTMEECGSVADALDASREREQG